MKNKNQSNYVEYLKKASEAKADLESKLIALRHIYKLVDDNGEPHVCHHCGNDQLDERYFINTPCKKVVCLRCKGILGVWKGYWQLGNFESELLWN